MSFEIKSKMDLDMSPKNASPLNQSLYCSFWLNVDACRHFSVCTQWHRKNSVSAFHYWVSPGLWVCVTIKAGALVSPSVFGFGDNSETLFSLWTWGCSELLWCSLCQVGLNLDVHIILILNIRTTLESWFQYFNAALSLNRILEYLWGWGYLTPWTLEWSCGKYSEVHHHSPTSWDSISLRRLELQRGGHHHFHQHQRHRGWIWRQDLIRPSHRSPGAQKPGAARQWGVHCDHHRRQRAAETGKDHSECVWWVLCGVIIVKKIVSDVL